MTPEESHGSSETADMPCPRFQGFSVTMQVMQNVRHSEDGLVEPRSPSLLTTAAAARRCACHPTTITRAAAAGELEALRLGPRGSLRIPEGALEDWLRPDEREAGR